VYVRRGGVLALPGKTEAGFRPGLEFTFRVAVVAVVALAATYGFVHFPEWVKGLRFQLARGSHGGIMYLNGALSRSGWYHYFFVALPLKLPLGLLIAAGVGAASLVARAARREAPVAARWVWLAVPPVVFFALASFTRVNLGVRVVLPCVPFLYLLAAGLLAPGAWRLPRSVLALGCLAWCAAAAQRINPHDLAYFNELAGGPDGGRRYVADSNLDWGQDLPALKKWMDEKGVPVVYLAYFGTDRPSAHGIRYRPLPSFGHVGPEDGEPIPAGTARHVVAVSVNHLVGLYLTDADAYAWLRGRTPTAVLNHTIYVYDLTGDPEAIRRLRELAP
jgi:hypothetical protein